MMDEKQLIKDLWRFIEEIIFDTQDLPVPDYTEKLSRLAERTRPYRESRIYPAFEATT